jgi:type IV secretion system protein VirD4
MNKVHISMYQSLCGKETIDLDTHGKSSGRNGNYSTNYQISGRELMTPDEVRLLDNRYALLFIRGERPIIDLKYNILKHPNIAFTTDGSGKPYIHGKIDRVTATIELDENVERYETEEQEILEDYELLSEEEIEKFLLEVT